MYNRTEFKKKLQLVTRKLQRKQHLAYCSINQQVKYHRKYHRKHVYLLSQYIIYRPMYSDNYDRAYIDDTYE